MLSATHAQSQNSEINLTDIEKKWIEEHPIIKSTSDNSWPPIDFVRAGEATGFSVDYLELIASKVGLKVEYHTAGWEELLGKMRLKELDVMHSVTRNPAREEYMLFSEPYLNLPTAYFAKAGQPRISSSSELVGKNVGYIEEWGLADAYVERHPNLDLIKLNTEQDALFALADGRIDVFVGSLAVMNYTMATNFMSEFEVIGFVNSEETGGEDQIHLSVRDDYSELLSILQKGMAAVTEAEYSFLMQKWQAAYEDNAQISLTDEERQWLDKNPVLTVSSQNEWGPFDFTERGTPSGFSIDYVKLLAEKVGFDVEFVTTDSWEEIIDFALAGKIDIVHSVNRSPERDQNFNFTEPYLIIPQAYFGRVGAGHINKVEDLEGLKIGVIDGWAITETMKRELPHLTYVTQPSPKDAFIAISSGEIDVFADNLPVSEYLISNNFIPGIEVVGTQYIAPDRNSDLLHLASLKTKPLLSSILEKGMAAISDEEFRNLTVKWQPSRIIDASLNLTEEEKEWLSNNPIVEIALDPSAAPFEYIENGTIQGFSGDFLNRISDLLQIEFRWSGNESLNEGFDYIRDGRAKLLPLVSQTPERLLFLDYTETFLNISNMIFSREGGEVYSTLQSLHGESIALVKGFSINEYVGRDHPEIQVVEVENVAEAISKLSSGEVEAYIGSIPVATKIIAENSLSNITVTGETPYLMNSSMAVGKNDQILLSILNKAMASISEAEKSDIIQRWLSLRVTPQVDYTLIWRVVLFATGLLFVVLVWVYSLRREISRREIVEQNLIRMQEEANEARVEAVLANKAKSTFLANMSHEIRTPLNAIIGFSDMISSGVFGDIKVKKYKEYIQHIKGSGVLLSEVINDILDLSKIEAGKWKLKEESFNLTDTIKDVFNMMLSPAHEKNLELRFDDADQFSSIQMVGDKNGFKRVLINLLSNAIKFTAEGGKVSCDLEKSQNGDIVIKIVDNGIGIPEHRLESVMVPFEQLESESEISQKGTGLGLSIVKELVELHGGKFKLDSVLGEGTQAILTLPSARFNS